MRAVVWEGKPFHLDVLGSTTPPRSWGVGVVVEVGQVNEHFKVGDRVLIPGVADTGHFSAEYLRVPFADDSLAGGSVAVFGAGPTGLMCAYPAILRGASTVYAIDHVRDRLDKAACIGAIPIDFTSEAGPASNQMLRREANGRLKRQPNYVIQEAIKVTKYNGGIGLVGAYAALGKSAGRPLADTVDAELSIPIPAMFLKHLCIDGGTAFELVRSGRIRLDLVVTSQVGIEGAPEAYERFHKKLVIKAVIRFPWSETEKTDLKAPK
ncbi:hypothetical protein N657DRAFT_658365 [Parathielavia appendiculata]|uniref:Alcohol dehydrogenase n=1 Tax=Parathielavia appendiculata TaxID=2587402 RepID=A0AAN6TV12_9PEZI|nr:hypothetical protein N657DRAFT_658365 [Parathielavia appendiculata]